MKLDILISGVGGQGTLLSSRILGSFAINKGLDCKLSEVHGMAQRGGSVVTHVRMGDKVYSPIIDEGTADVLLAYEELEAIRYGSIVKPNGIILYSTQKILPMPVVSGTMAYPEGAAQNLKNATGIDAVSLAIKAGNIKAANIVMLGVLAKKLDLSYNEFTAAVLENIPKKFTEVNLKAFDLGYNL